MNSKQKQKRFSRNISIVLAILIVSTLCVTIAALTASHRKKTTNDPTSSTEASTVSTEPTSSQTEKTLSPTESTQAPTEEPQGTKPSDPAVTVIEWGSPATGSIVGGYSADVPVFSVTMEDYRTHSGIDIEGDAGDAVFAAADGTVEKVYYDPMMGQTVVISHSGNYKTIYQNMQTSVPEGITAGAKVKKGDRIGSIGDTALIEISESPHLHFAVTVDGKYSDPLSYITVSASAASTWYED